MGETPITPRRQQLLLVDDVPANLDVLLQMLEPEGYLVLVATSGEKALKIAAQAKPDLILLDIMMPPGIDGYEVCARLKADQVTVAIPVIFLSALDDAEVKVKAFQVGGVDYITKPFEAAEVMARVQMHLRTRALFLEAQAAREAAERARREAEQANEAKSRFLTTMSHEIRTPLTALLGFADLLLEAPLSETARLEFTRTIRRNGEHLLAVVNDVLDFTKLEASDMAVVEEDCPPAALLAEVAALMGRRAAARGLDFDVRLLSPIPALIRSDRTRLREILLNLVGNAIKFTDQGSLFLFARYEAGAARLAFDVIDTGVGMDATQLANLFVPFQQGDMSMTRRYGGTGLSLAICQSLANALGGEIRVRSTAGRGSTFTLTLAVQVPEGTPMVADLADVHPRADAPPMRLQGRVLLAEDGPDNQVLIMTLLRNAGVTVSLAEDGRAALEEALRSREARQPYDLILMDMQMPELDGYAATMELRRQGYDGPVVALTAHALAGERERCLEAGCDDYLSKPIDRPQFARLLARYLTLPDEDQGTPAETSSRRAG